MIIWMMRKFRNCERKCIRNNGFYFLPTFEATKTTSTITATTINIPTPMPALKIPLTTEQLVSENAIEVSSILEAMFFMISNFKLRFALIFNKINIYQKGRKHLQDMCNKLQNLHCSNLFNLSERNVNYKYSTLTIRACCFNKTVMIFNNFFHNG